MEKKEILTELISFRVNKIQLEKLKKEAMLENRSISNYIKTKLNLKLK